MLDVGHSANGTDFVHVDGTDSMSYLQYIWSRELSPTSTSWRLGHTPLGSVGPLEVLSICAPGPTLLSDDSESTGLLTEHSMITVLTSLDTSTY